MLNLSHLCQLYIHVGSSYLDLYGIDGQECDGREAILFVCGKRRGILICVDPPPFVRDHGRSVFNDTLPIRDVRVAVGRQGRVLHLQHSYRFFGQRRCSIHRSDRSLLNLDND